MKTISTFVVLIVCAHLMCDSVEAWGKEGHEIVASIAQDSLSSDVFETLKAFLDGSNLADIAPLPDDYDHSDRGKWSSPCHYVNLPRGDTGFKWGDCPLFCVVEAINNYTELLREQKSNPIACNYNQKNGVEPCPLEFLVHFVGDIHQPLHISYADDEGGNKVQAEFFGSETNLHAVWDTKIIQKWQPFNNMRQAIDDLEKMISENPTTVKQILSTTDPVAWANESLAFTIANAYNYSTNSHGVAQIDEDYYQNNLEVIKWRLIAAGLRLGQLLTNTLTMDPETPPVIESLPRIFQTAQRQKHFAIKTN